MMIPEHLYPGRGATFVVTARYHIPLADLGRDVEVKIKMEFYKKDSNSSAEPDSIHNSLSLYFSDSLSRDNDEATIGKDKLHHNGPHKEFVKLLGKEYKEVPFDQDEWVKFMLNEAGNFDWDKELAKFGLPVENMYDLQFKFYFCIAQSRR